MYDFAGNGASARLLAQLTFLGEIDRLKQILRRTSLIGGSRRENSAEHSWHVALAAVMLAEHANGEVDVAHVVKMLLVHDLVEIDAGDTFAYDVVGKATQVERELAAAKHIFGLLPENQGAELMALWQEFDGRTTRESKFANAMDRLLPALQNYANEGGTWRDPRVTYARVVERMQPVEEGAPDVGAFVAAMIADATARWPHRARYMNAADQEGSSPSPGAFYVCTTLDCGLRFPVVAGVKWNGRCPRCRSAVIRVADVPLGTPANGERNDSLPEFHLLLDNWRSLFNVGSALRTADGAGVRHVYLCGITATPDHPKLAKTALGAGARGTLELPPRCCEASRVAKSAGGPALGAGRVVGCGTN